MANEGRISFEGHDISQLEDLHAFMALRDASPVFDRSKKIGDIGIPCIVTASGEVRLDWQEYFREQGFKVVQADAEGPSCSIDGSGC
jgi:glutaredoxin-related protein